MKPADGMETMKTDMGGAAAVLGAMSALRSMNAGVEVVAYLASAENMPSGTAVKPGDVFKARNGKTIEVLNTDAEGRLVLADALSLAAESEPDAIVDIATLTGACVVALGRHVAGYFASDGDLADALAGAAARAGEKIWRLPLETSYRADIESDVGDLRNTSKSKGAGAITAALLLAEFTGDVPWAHLDIAGPGRSDAVDGINVKGATGFGVRTLLELTDRWSGRRS